MPVVQLTTHVKSSTLYGHTVIFQLDGLLLFCIIMGLRSASSAIIQPYFADNMHNDTAGNSNSYVFWKLKFITFI